MNQQPYFKIDENLNQMISICIPERGVNIHPFPLSGEKHNEHIQSLRTALKSNVKVVAYKRKGKDNKYKYGYKTNNGKFVYPLWDGKKKRCVSLNTANFESDVLAPIQDAISTILTAASEKYKVDLSTYTNYNFTQRTLLKNVIRTTTGIR